MTDAARFLRRAGKPLIYGHRGVRGPLPENTLVAFEQARLEGADGVELDVRPCGSGELVVFHDPQLTRATTGTDTRSVHDVPYDELRRLDLGGGAQVPRLTEVLAWARSHRLRVNVEVKQDVPERRAAVRAVARAVEVVPDAGRFLHISSFDPAILLALRAGGVRVPLAFLFHEGQRRYRPWVLSRAMPVEALHPERTLTEPDQVAAARRAGRVINVWTVNDENEARALSALGVDGIITDRPGPVGEAARSV
jgi:glycerophosphoryl diester phosphodiesterase